MSNEQKTTGQVVGETLGGATEAVKGAVGAIQDTIHNPADAAKKALGGIGGLIGKLGKTLEGLAEHPKKD